VGIVRSSNATHLSADSNCRLAYSDRSLANGANWLTYVNCGLPELAIRLANRDISLANPEIGFAYANCRLTQTAILLPDTDCWLTEAIPLTNANRRLAKTTALPAYSNRGLTETAAATEPVLVFPVPPMRKLLTMMPMRPAEDRNSISPAVIRDVPICFNHFRLRRRDRFRARLLCYGSAFFIFRRIRNPLTVLIYLPFSIPPKDAWLSYYQGIRPRAFAVAQKRCCEKH